VTYLLDGQVLHRDSLGSEQVIRPGQLNLMTAGRGLSHAEEPTGHYRGTLHGVQLWVAQPEASRHGAPAFAHYEALPQVAPARARTRRCWSARSPAPPLPPPADTPLLGVSIDLRPGATDAPLEPSYEHLLVVLDGVLVLEDRAGATGPERLPRAGAGSRWRWLAPDGARVLLLGGRAVRGAIVMWWNFVGRSREELAEAGRQWAAADDRFGRVRTSPARVPFAAAVAVDARALVLARTRLQSPPVVPELTLHLADDMEQAWAALQDELDDGTLPPPFWAFAWLGGQAVAGTCSTTRSWWPAAASLDLATGSGLCALAALLAGATDVTAVDVDPSPSRPAASTRRTTGWLSTSTAPTCWRPRRRGSTSCWQETSSTTRRCRRGCSRGSWRPATAAARCSSATPGRHYLPRARMQELASYDVPTTRELEGVQVKQVRVYALA
jgi:redox-sensitive bicupin YhaK (pirin superfamily)/predicted nicotinamide N-methyase